MRKRRSSHEHSLDRGGRSGGIGRFPRAKLLLSRTHPICPCRRFVVEGGARFSLGAQEAAEGMLRGILIQAFLEEAPFHSSSDASRPRTSRRGTAASAIRSHGAPSVSHDAHAAEDARPQSGGRRGATGGRASLDSFEREPLFLGPPAMPVGARAVDDCARRITRGCDHGATVADHAGVAGGVRRHRTDTNRKPRLRRPRNRASPRRCDGACHVPLLVGETLREARAQLERVGLVIGNVKEAPGGDAVGTITTQKACRGRARVSERGSIWLLQLPRSPSRKSCVSRRNPGVRQRFRRIQRCLRSSGSRAKWPAIESSDVASSSVMSA